MVGQRQGNAVLEFSNRKGRIVLQDNRPIALEVEIGIVKVTILSNEGRLAVAEQRRPTIRADAQADGTARFRPYREVTRLSPFESFDDLTNAIGVSRNLENQVSYRKQAGSRIVG